MTQESFALRGQDEVLESIKGQVIIDKAGERQADKLRNISQLRIGTHTLRRECCLNGASNNSALLARCAASIRAASNAQAATALYDHRSYAKYGRERH
jgi:hypothetical protein